MRHAQIKSFPPSGPVINAAYSSAAASCSTQSTADAEAVSMATTGCCITGCCISPTAWSQGLGLSKGLGWLSSLGLHGNLTQQQPRNRHIDSR